MILGLDTPKYHNVGDIRRHANLGTHVSLGPKNESVRGALSQEFQEYLKRLHMWFEQIANLRHAVADEVAYKDFETKMSENIKRTSQTTIDSRRNK